MFNEMKSKVYDKSSIYLVKVIQSCVQVGMHTSRRLICDLNGIF